MGEVQPPAGAVETSVLRGTAATQTKIEFYPADQRVELEPLCRVELDFVPNSADGDSTRPFRTMTACLENKESNADDDDPKQKQRTKITKF